MVSRSLLAVALVLTACGAPPRPLPLPAAPPAPISAAQRLATAYGGPKIRVGIGAFEELEGTRALFEAYGWTGLGALISEQAVTGLVATGRVAVLERAQIGKVIGNLQLEKESGAAKYFDQKTTVATGKLQGVQAMLVGAITDFEPNVSEADAGVTVPLLGDLKYHQDKAVVGVEVRLVDQETGRVIQAGSGRGEVITRSGGANLSYKGLQLGTDAFSRTPIGEATRQAASQAIDALIAKLPAIPWEGGVASVSGPEKIYLDAGRALNLKAGDRLEVIRRGAPIKDAGGAVIGHEEAAVGQVEIVSVQPKMSIARVVGGDLPAAGDRVRLASGP